MASRRPAKQNNAGDAVATLALQQFVALYLILLVAVDTPHRKRTVPGWQYPLGRIQEALILSFIGGSYRVEEIRRWSSIARTGAAGHAAHSYWCTVRYKGARRVSLGAGSLNRA